MNRESKSLLDTLADIAAQTIPISSANNIKSEFPENKNTNRRPRAMSEPWIRGSTFSSLLTPPINNGNGSSSSSSNVITLPQMLEKYSSIYNTNGRIGIYTREERDAIISRFHEKRKKRVWVKKIRYHCRKNLADNRIRVKGRFVRNTDVSVIHDHDDDYEDDEDGDGQETPLSSLKEKDFPTSDALSALLFVSERRLELEKEFQADDNLSNGSGSTSTSTQYNIPHGSKRKKHSLRTTHEDNIREENPPELEPVADNPEASSSPSIPPEEMSLIENVRSRKRMRRHSIAY